MKRKAEDEEPILAPRMGVNRARYTNPGEEVARECAPQPERHWKAEPPAIPPLGARFEIEADGTGAHPAGSNTPQLAQNSASGGPAPAMADTEGPHRAKRAFHGQPDPCPCRAGMRHSPGTAVPQSSPDGPQALLQASDVGSPPAAAAAATVQTRARSADARAHVQRASAQSAVAATGQARVAQQISPDGKAAGAAMTGGDDTVSGVNLEGGQSMTGGGRQQGKASGRAVFKVCLRKVKLRPDGTPDEAAAPQLLRSPRRTRSAALAQSPPLLPGHEGARTGTTPAEMPSADLPHSSSPASPRRNPVRRVRFAKGPLDSPPDGHPAHEGQTARQRRFLEASYPLDLTPHRVGLLPRIVRPRRHVTHARTPAPPPARQQAAGGGALRTLRVLRPRLALAFNSDSDDDADLDSPTSSSTLSADMWGSPARPFLRSTASTAPPTPESPKAPWSAAGGGVRHGAARSVAAGRRKTRAPVCARPQSPRGVPAFFSRPSKSQQLRQQQQSPRKRPAQDHDPEAAGKGGGADCAAGGSQPRSPRHLRPLLFAAANAAVQLGSDHPSAALPTAHTSRDIPPILPLRLLCPGSLPQPQAASQHTFLLRSGSLKGGAGGGASSGAALGASRISPQPQSPARGLSCAWRPTSPRKHHSSNDDATAACTSATDALPPNGGPAADASQKLPGGSLLGGIAAAMEGGAATAKAAVWGQQRPLLHRPEGSPGALAGGETALSQNRPGRVQLGSLFDPVMSSARLLRSNL